jgi:hypothetical protein
MKISLLVTVIRYSLVTIVFWKVQVKTLFYTFNAKVIHYNLDETVTNGNNVTSVPSSFKDFSAVFAKKLG